MDVVKYRVYFPEYNGLFYVEDLPASTHGSSACLVLGSVSGKVYVRKKKAQIDSNPPKSKCPEVHHHQKHDHIPHQFHVERFPNSLIGCPSSTTSFGIVSHFCNRGSLSQIFEKFNFLNKKLPEPIAWRMMLHMLRGLAFLHTQGKPRVSHGAITPQNILVDLPNTGPGYFPDFYLGDMDQSCTLEITGGNNPEGYDASKHDVAQRVAADISSVAKCVLKALIKDFDAEDFQAALQRIQGDRFYTPGLSKILSELLNFETIAGGNGNWDLRNYNLTPILNRVRKALDEQSNDLSKHITASWQKQFDLPQVLEFDSEDELKRHTNLPAGPWSIAAVNARTGKIISTRGNYRADAL